MAASQHLVSGQDVAFVATSAHMAAEALAWANVGPSDVLYELGCGNGTVAIEAARRGAAAVCIESDATLAAAAEAAARDAGVGGLVDVRRENIFSADVRDATVVYLYLLPALNARLAPSLARQLSRPSSRVLTRSFEVLGWPCGKRTRFAGHADTLFLQWQAPFVRARLSDRLYLEPRLLEEHCAEHALSCSAEEEATAQAEEVSLRRTAEVAVDMRRDEL